MTAPTLLIVFFGVVIWLLLSARFSRQALWLLLLWIPVQGWVQLNLLDNADATVLIYEFHIVGLYLVFAVRALREPAGYRVPRIMWFALPFTAWVLALVPLSLDTTGPVLTLIGLRTYLLPLPLVWLGYHAFVSRRELENLGWAIMVEMVLVAGVGAAQYLGTTTSSGAVVALPNGFVISGTVRPPGTFSAPGHFGMYVLALIPLGIGFLAMKVPAWKRAGFIVGLLSTTVALVVNSQRSTVVLLAVTLPLIIVLARRLRAVTAIVAAAAFVMIGGAAGLQVVGGAFADRVSSIVQDAEFTLVTAPMGRMDDALATPWMGSGLGIASPGVSRVAVGSAPGARFRDSAKSAESFMAALVYQTGVPGLLAFYLFLGAVLYAGLQSVRACRKSDLAVIAAAIFAYEVAICLQSWSYDPLHYPPSRVLFWFWGGVLLSLPRLQGQQVVSHANSARPRAERFARGHIPGGRRVPRLAE